MAEEQEAVDSGRQAFAEQVDAALAFAAEHVYAYGPRWRRRKLAWEVASVEERGAVVRVTLEYRPEGAFKGEPGVEWIEVGPGGRVTARNQVRSPREELPWALIGAAAASVIAAAVLVPLLLLWGRGGETLEESVRGRHLWMWTSAVETAPRFYFRGEDIGGEVRTWVVLPEHEGNEMALVRVELHNDSSASSHLYIDEAAATLESMDWQRYSPVNPLERVLALAEGERPEEAYVRSDVLPIWGSVDIETDHALKGVMFFEVRKGSTFQTFRWQATDAMTRRY